MVKTWYDWTICAAGTDGYAQEISIPVCLAPHPTPDWSDVMLKIMPDGVPDDYPMRFPDTDEGNADLMRSFWPQN